MRQILITNVLDGSCCNQVFIQHFWFMFGGMRIEALLNILRDGAGLAKLAKLADNLSLFGKRLPQLRSCLTNRSRAVMNGGRLDPGFENLSGFVHPCICLYIALCTSDQRPGLPVQ